MKHGGRIAKSGNDQPGETLLFSDSVKPLSENHISSSPEQESARPNSCQEKSAATFGYPSV